MKFALLIFGLLYLAILGQSQTFQYSKGWTVGKRGLVEENSEMETINPRVLLTTGQLLSACRNFISVYRNEADGFAPGMLPKALSKREAALGMEKDPL